jgi:UDP-N-acetylmuramoyl-tripeptide--D-alanyl-D-alanine ligase
MRLLLLSEIISATGGKVLYQSAKTPSYGGSTLRIHQRVLRRRIKSISTDTRNIKRGDLFVAIKGANFDGNDFLLQAQKQGASAIIASKSPVGIKIPLIMVKDTVKALGDIASYYRTKVNAKVIAITGSNGKTTTKEMLCKILSSMGETLESPKSYNNFIGVPLTMFMVNPAHKYVIFELGTNQKGEIPYLANIVKPDIAVITNIGPSHLAGLGSIAGVARAKASLFKYLKPSGVAIMEYDNKILKPHLKGIKNNIITFGLDSNSDIWVTNVSIKNNGIEFLLNGLYKCFLPVMGAWNVSNALAALSVVYAFGLDLKKACNSLKNCHLPPMRMQKETVKGITFINDAYNANPLSTAGLIDELGLMRLMGRKILVFGEMMELGKYSVKYHREIADKISQAKLDEVILVGAETRATEKQLKENKFTGRVFSFKSAVEISDKLCIRLKEGDIVAFKGSRGVGLDKVLERIKSALKR